MTFNEIIEACTLINQIEQEKKHQMLFLSAAINFKVAINENNIIYARKMLYTLRDLMPLLILGDEDSFINFNRIYKALKDEFNSIHTQSTLNF